MPRKNFNTTIDEGTIEKITALAVNGKSKGEIVDMAIALLAAPKVNPNEEISRWFRETWTRLDELLELAQNAEPLPVYSGPDIDHRSVRGPERFDPAQIPGVTTAAKAPVVIKRYSCQHHQGDELAVARVGDICADCRAHGHYGDTRDCSRCGDYGTGAL